MKDNIEITTGDVRDDSGIATGAKNAVVTDRKSGRAWSSEGKTADEATTGAVRKFLGDRRSREYAGE